MKMFQTGSLPIYPRTFQRIQIQKPHQAEFREPAQATVWFTRTAWKALSSILTILSMSLSEGFQAEILISSL